MWANKASVQDSNDRGKSPARGGKESSCATTPDSSASDRHVDELLSNDKEKPFKEEGRKDRRNRKVPSRQMSDQCSVWLPCRESMTVVAGIRLTGRH